jgi:hypothetical protein
MCGGDTKTSSINLWHKRWQFFLDSKYFIGIFLLVL